MHNTSKTKGRHFLNRMEEFKLCLWVLIKNRHENISSIARFRYALESSFNDVINDFFSKSKVGGRGPIGFVEGPIRLDNEQVAGENDSSSRVPYPRRGRMSASTRTKPHQQDDRLVRLVSGFSLVFASFWVSGNPEPGCLLYNM